MERSNSAVRKQELKDLHGWSRKRRERRGKKKDYVRKLLLQIFRSDICETSQPQTRGKICGGEFNGLWPICGVTDERGKMK